MMSVAPMMTLYSSVFYKSLGCINAKCASRYALYSPEMRVSVMDSLRFALRADVRRLSSTSWSGQIGPRRSLSSAVLNSSECGVMNAGAGTTADELALQESVAEYCREIVEDPLSDVSVEETSKFLIPYPKRDKTYLVDLLTRPFRKSHMHEPAEMMVHLCVERLENDELTSRFAIGPGFNKRAYFLMLHVWLLHRRAMREIPLGILLDRYLFQIAFDLFKGWLFQRKVPEHRFKREHENCLGFMMKFLVELDQATLDEDLYPYKISQVIRHHMYEDDVDDATLRLLVKYVLRQFVHICNIGQEHFLDAMFLWADTEPICRPARLLKRAMPQLIKYGGYKPTQSGDRTQELGTGSTKLTE